MHSSTTVALSLLASAPAANAWGVIGHATVANIATNYLTSGAQTFVSNLLGSGVTMASVASWADTFRYTSGGHFSAPFHFIDAEDTPPTSCSVDFNRDCTTKGCSISAIQNYTSRVQDSTLSAADQTDALKFLIHFLGDITQPLHDEAEKVGGNGIKVTWNGKATNLHHTWDTEMVEKLAGGSSASVETSFAQTLIADIDSGIYSSQAASWINCTDITNAEACALTWAQDANVINCEFVLKDDETGQELDGDYYTGAAPYVSLQIAKAGYRLGAWLNNIAAAQGRTASS